MIKNSSMLLLLTILFMGLILMSRPLTAVSMPIVDIVDQSLALETTSTSPPSSAVSEFPKRSDLPPPDNSKTVPSDKSPSEMRMPGWGTDVTTPKSASDLPKNEPQNLKTPDNVHPNSPLNVPSSSSPSSTPSSVPNSYPSSSPSSLPSSTTPSTVPSSTTPSSLPSSTPSSLPSNSPSNLPSGSSRSSSNSSSSINSSLDKTSIPIHSSSNAYPDHREPSGTGNDRTTHIPHPSSTGAAAPQPYVVTPDSSTPGTGPAPSSARSGTSKPIEHHPRAPAYIPRGDQRPLDERPAGQGNTDDLKRQYD